MDIQILKEMLSEDKFNELNEALKDKEGKLADLSKSDYVSSAKYNVLNQRLFERTMSKSAPLKNNERQHIPKCVFSKVPNLSIHHRKLIFS